MHNLDKLLARLIRDIVGQTTSGKLMTACFIQDTILSTHHKVLFDLQNAAQIKQYKYVTPKREKDQYLSRFSWAYNLESLKVKCVTQ